MDYFAVNIFKLKSMFTIKPLLKVLWLPTVNIYHLNVKHLEKQQMKKH